MSDFRSLLEEINESVARYDEVDELLEREEESLVVAQNLVNDLKEALSQKEVEQKLAQDSVDQLKEKQVTILKLIWDTESELHALMPDDYKAEEVKDSGPPASSYQSSGWPS